MSDPRLTRSKRGVETLAPSALDPTRVDPVVHIYIDVGPDIASLRKRNSAAAR